MTNITPSRARTIALTLATLCASAMAAAQTPTEAVKARLEPPEMRFLAKDQGVSFLTTLSMLVLVGVVVGGSCIPSKRGHQD